jgi:Spy/CpxP family protein refolding chaperone
MKQLSRMQVTSALALVLITAGATALAAGPGQMPTQEAPPSGAPSQSSQNQPSDPFSDALSKANLNDQQKSAVEQIGKQVGAKEQAVGNASHALNDALADQLKSGNVDENALKDKVDALVKAEQDAAPARQKAMDDLHGVLDPKQRTAFADSMENSLKQASTGQPPSASAGIDSMAKDLNLTDDQKRKLQDVIGQPPAPSNDARDAQIAAFEAFKKDDFSSEKTSPSGDVAGQTRDTAKKMIDSTKAIAAILTPEQRQKLATEMKGPSQSSQRG